MISIRHLLCSIFLTSTLNVVAQEQAEPGIPRFLMGQVAGERLTLNILPEGASPIAQKLKGTRFINVEPGCLMLEAYVKLVGENKLEIRFPHDDSITTRAMNTMGVSSKNVIVTFEPSKTANQARSIVAVTPIQTKTSEQGADGDAEEAP